jgi:hypothetical protein
MKRRILGKTTLFHAFKKKGGKTKQFLFRRHCSSFFFPWTRNRGREVFVLFRLFLPLSRSPRALLKPKPDATRTSS